MVRVELRTSWVKEHAPKIKARAGLTRCLRRILPCRQQTSENRTGHEKGLPGLRGPRRVGARPRSMPCEQCSRLCVPSSPRMTQEAAGDLHVVRVQEKVPVLLLVQEEACLPSWACPALPVSASETAQMRGRKQEVGMEEGWRRRANTESSHLRKKNQGIQKSRGEEKNHQHKRIFLDVQSFHFRSVLQGQLSAHAFMRSADIHTCLPGPLQM